MWHKQGSRDYKLSSQHGTDLCYDADGRVSQYKLLSVNWHQIREKTNGESEERRWVVDFPKAALKEMAFPAEGCGVNRIKIELHSLFFCKSCFEIIFINKKP